MPFELSELLRGWHAAADGGICLPFETAQFRMGFETWCAHHPVRR